jgi:hypothetical protein
MPSPRIFKSHMPHGKALGGGPRKAPCRYIYIARNPKGELAAVVGTNSSTNRSVAQRLQQCSGVQPHCGC